MHKNTGQVKGQPDSPDPRPPISDPQLPTDTGRNRAQTTAAPSFEIRNAKFDYTLLQSGRRNEDSLGSALPADALDIFTYFPIHSIHHPPCLRLDSSLPFVERIDPHPSVQLI